MAFIAERPASGLFDNYAAISETAQRAWIRNR